MRYTNSKGSFRDYAYYIEDVRYKSIKEEDAETYEEELNSWLETLKVDGYTVVMVNTAADEVYFKALIGYVPSDKIYYEEVEGGEKDGGE